MPEAASNSVLGLYTQRESLGKRITGTQSGGDALKLALELEPTVLNPAVLGNPEQSGRTEFRTALSLYNRALLRSWELDKKSLIDNGALTRYAKVFLMNCTIPATSCPRLQQAATDHLSAQVLLLYGETLEPEIVKTRQIRDEILNHMARSKSARCRGGGTPRQIPCTEALKIASENHQQATQKYFDLMRISLDMSNKSTRPQVDQKYVRYSQDFSDYVRALPESPSKSAMLTQHRNTLGLALGNLRHLARTGRSSQEYCQFLFNLNPLQMDQFQKMNVDQRHVRAMIHEYIECAYQAKKLNQTINEHMRKDLELKTRMFTKNQATPVEILRVLDEGYAYAIKELEDYPFMYKNLGIQLENRMDLPVYVIDRVFYQDIDMQTALEFWKRADVKNDLEMLRFIRNYARVQAAYTLKVTLLNFNRILERQYKEKQGLNSIFFTDVIKDVSTTSQMDWHTLQNRLAALRDFLSKVFDQKYSGLVGAALKPAQEEYIEFKNELDQFPDNINLAVVGPMSLVLHYFMSQTRGTLKIQTGTSQMPLEIPASEALSTYFGKTDSIVTQPYFALSRVRPNINAQMRPYIFDYMLRTGMFDLINFKLASGEEDKNTPGEVLFMRQYARTTFNSLDSNLRERLKNLELLESSYIFRHQVLGYCQNPLSTPANVALNNFPFGALQQDSSISGGLNRIYDAHSTARGAYNSENEMLPIIRRLQAHFSANSKSTLSAERARVGGSALKAIQAEMQSVLNLADDVMARSVRLDRQLVQSRRDCLERLDRANWLQLRTVMILHKEYYKDVHAAMTLLRNTPREDVEPDVAERMERLKSRVEAHSELKAMPLKAALNRLLSIHNDDRPEFNNVGFFVSGLNLSSTRRALNTHNEFDESNFLQGRWDSLMRSRHFFEFGKVDASIANPILGTQYNGVVPIAPNIRIPLGEFPTLDNNALYRDIYRRQLQYDANQSQFVREAMAHLARTDNSQQLQSWMSQVNSELVGRRMQWLNDLRSYDGIKMSAEDVHNCPTDSWGRLVGTMDLAGRPLKLAQNYPKCQALHVSGQDFLDQFLKVLETLRIDPIDRALLEWIGEQGKSQDRIISLLAYNSEPSTTQWTYFDRFFSNFFGKSMGQVWDSATGETKEAELRELRGSQAFRNFKRIYEDKVLSSYYLFPLSREFTEIVMDFAREPILKHVAEAEDFVTAVRKFENRGIDLGDFLIERVINKRSDEPYAYGNWRVMQVAERTSGKRKNTPIYLADHGKAMFWFRSNVIESFFRDTNCLALPKSDKDDVMARTRSLTPGDCNRRLREWLSAFPNITGSSASENLESEN